MDRLPELFRNGAGRIAAYAASHKAALALLSVALLSRLPLLSISLDEVDSANFFNALANGYHIPLMRPHPPGYPVYVFMSWTLNQVIRDPLLSLTLLSALLGSLAVIPFFSLLRHFVGSGMAFVGSLLFLFNPLYWSLSESALSDVPSLFFAVSLAWLSYKARHSDRAFLLACVTFSLAVGVRQPNIALILLLTYPMIYRAAVDGKLSWRLPALGTAIFLATALLWFVPSVYLGSGGLSDYSAAVVKQWETAVRIYDITQVDGPWIMNAPIRIQRFFFGYFLTYAWTGGDAKTFSSVLLVTPWVFGFALFVTGFNFRDSRYVFTGMWVATALYSILAIHFLSRYGMPQLPGFVIACLLGYRFLADELTRHPRRFEVLSVAVIGTLLILSAIKYQSPVSTFEYSPLEGNGLSALLLVAGIMFVVLSRVVYGRHPDGAAPSRSSVSALIGWRPTTSKTVVIVFLVIVTLVFAAKGYTVASVAHNESSPGQRLVEYVQENFETAEVTPCWDNQTHSLFEAITPAAVPTGYWSIDDLYDSRRSGNILLVTDRCPWFDELNEELGLVHLADFDGASPLWAKTPSIQLYATSTPNS